MFPTPLVSILAALGFGGAPATQPAQVNASPVTFGRPAASAPAQKVKPTVAAPVARSAGTGAVRGTMVMVHGGGWTGPNAEAQDSLLDEPGAVMVARGWRVVSIDYKEGIDGLTGVLDEIGAELTQPAGGLLCVYGESAGAQLALVAAARMPGIDCVIAAGAPTDFAAFRDDAAKAGGGMQGVYTGLLEPTFGPPGPGTAPWEPVKVASSINADVLLFRQADDLVVPPGQADAFVRALPTTRLVDLPAGNFDDPSQRWLHGSLSDPGRALLHGEIGAFIDREADGRRAARSAQRTGCRRATQALNRLGMRRLRSALRCLARARREPAAARATRRAAAPVHAQIRGQVTPARVWSALRATPAGRAMLAELATPVPVRVSVRLGSRSRVLVGRR